MLSGEELKQLIWFRSLSMAEQRRLAPSSMTQITTSASSAEGFYAATRAGRKKLTAVLEPETHKHSGCWRFREALVLAEIVPAVEQGQQRPRRRRLDDQPLTLLAHHRGAAGKLEFAGNADNLIATVAE